MCKIHIVDECSRISSGKNQTHFTDSTMKNRLSLLDKLIGIDGQLGNVFMPDKGLRTNAGRRVVEVSVGVNAIFPSLKQSVTQYVPGLAMTMLPNKRNSYAV